MSKEGQRITGAAAPITFHDGTTYQMSPLSDRDIQEMDLWAQARYIQVSRAGIPDSVSKEDRDAEMRSIRREAMGITWLSGLGASLVATVDGMCRLLWQSIKANHPDVLENDLRAKFFDPDVAAQNVDEIREMFERLNRVPGGDQKNPPSRRHKDRKKRRRRKGKSTGR